MNEYFLWVCSGESPTVFFTPTATNVDSEILSLYGASLEYLVYF